MALVACRECGTEISDQALACPKCGAPPKLTVKRLLKKPIVAVAIVLGLVFFGRWHILQRGYRRSLRKLGDLAVLPRDIPCEARVLRADKVILPGSPSDCALGSRS